MPKIITDIKNIILTEAKKQLLNDGYLGMTLRSVASGCGIAVGTIYNYFSSKDVLIASFMLEDWVKALEEMKKGCDYAESPSEVFACVYRGVVDYSDVYAKLFKDEEARRNADGFLSTRHSMLRGQLASLLITTCRDNALHYTPYLPEFIAETILSNASERRDFSELSEILVQLFKNQINK